MDLDVEEGAKGGYIQIPSQDLPSQDLFQGLGPKSLNLDR